MFTSFFRAAQTRLCEQVDDLNFRVCMAPIAAKNIMICYDVLKESLTNIRDGTVRQNRLEPGRAFA